MENIFQSIILGLVQGLGEFLPISSSGHLVITPWILNFSDPGLAFDVALHTGTLLAVLVYFWKDWKKIFMLAFLGKEKENSDYDKNILWLLTVATIPGILAGVFLERAAETLFRNPLLIAFTLLFFGLLLFVFDKYSPKEKSIKNIKLSDAVVIGLSQALAIVPGVSRSGITITTALSRGFERVASARFSFLLATPIIFGATVYKLPELLQREITIEFWVGVFVSALSGYLAIKYLIKFVEKVSYKIFFWYRLVLAFLIVGFYLFT